MTLDTIGAVIGYAQGLYLMGEEELRDIWLDGETLLRLSQLSGIPVARLVSGPITADEYADLTEWMETLTDEVVGLDVSGMEANNHG